MTIKDIAIESGYAVGTVSRVLNGSSDVSEKARETIMAVVEKYNFHPNANARQLKQANSDSVAIIVRGVGNLLFVTMLEHLQQLFQQENRAVSVFYIPETDNEVALAARINREFKPKGIIFLGGELENFRTHFSGINVPCVLLSLGGEVMGYTNLSSISTDDTDGGCCAMEYLLNAGHKEIGVITSQNAYRAAVNGMRSIGGQRLDGCVLACTRFGVPFDIEKQSIPSPYSVDGGYHAALELLDRLPDITAIMATSDVTAIGAIRAVYDRGLRVPEDVSVIGFDGLSLSQFMVPRLATIRQDTQKMAQRAVEIMLSQLNRKKAPVHEIVPYQFISGESVKVL